MRAVRARLGRIAGWAALALAGLLGACVNHPPAPDWQVNASNALERSLDAWLAGDSRVAAQEFERVKSEIARTGRPALLARAELARCAARVASLVLGACSEYESLAADAEPAEQAYAAYLVGRATAADAARLPERHRPLAAAAGTPADTVAAIDRMPDPLGRLVGAAVSLQAGRADPRVVALAVETASSQGWRRPLLAWLEVQANQAATSGEIEDEARIRRRIALVGAPADRSAAPAPAPRAERRPAGNP